MESDITFGGLGWDFEIGKNANELKTDLRGVKEREEDKDLPSVCSCVV